jgi:hypothetical protein
MENIDSRPSIAWHDRLAAALVAFGGGILVIILLGDHVFDVIVLLICHQQASACGSQLFSPEAGVRLYVGIVLCSGLAISMPLIVYHLARLFVASSSIGMWRLIILMVLSMSGAFAGGVRLLGLVSSLPERRVDLWQAMQYTLWPGLACQIIVATLLLALLFVHHRRSPDA